MSKTRRIIQVILLIVVVGSVGYLIAKEFYRESHTNSELKGQPSTVTARPADINIKPDHIIAYYFHGNFRCTACRKIEAYSKDSIDANFLNEINKGILSFRVVNVEQPENRHFIHDYGLYTKSLVVVSYAGDKQIRHKNLENVWNYLNSKDKFENYVKTELSGFINEVSK